MLLVCLCSVFFMLGFDRAISPGFFLEIVMRPSFRKGVNKRRSARGFRKQVGRTKAANLNGPNRGGYRF